MQTALAVISGLLCAAAGFRQSCALQASQARLKRWKEILEHLALILSEGSCTLPEAFNQAASTSQAPDMLLRSLAKDMLRFPLQSLPELWESCHTEGEECASLSRMMQRLCRGSLESRCQAVRQATQELELMCAQSRDKYAKDARMWRTLGMLGGACITIMLL